MPGMRCRDGLPGNPALWVMVHFGNRIIPLHGIRRPPLTRRALDFAAHFTPSFIPNSQFGSGHCNPEWRNRDHFANCSNFEQSLLKLMTRRKRWSTSAGSGWPEGCSLVVQVSGGALARTSSVNPSIKIKSKFSGK
jgi:hypothetical protein